MRPTIFVSSDVNIQIIPKDPNYYGGPSVVMIPAVPAGYPSIQVIGAKTVYHHHDHELCAQGSGNSSPMSMPMTPPQMLLQQQQLFFQQQMQMHEQPKFEQQQHQQLEEEPEQEPSSFDDGNFPSLGKQPEMQQQQQQQEMWGDEDQDHEDPSTLGVIGDGRRSSSSYEEEEEEEEVLPKWRNGWPWGRSLPKGGKGFCLNFYNAGPEPKNGGCDKGGRCKFSHDFPEFKENTGESYTEVKARRAKQDCRSYVKNNGYCDRGDECHYKHNPDHPDIVKCLDFENHPTECKWGDKCRFHHVWTSFDERVDSYETIGICEKAVMFNVTPKEKTECTDPECTKEHYIDSRDLCSDVGCNNDDCYLFHL